MRIASFLHVLLLLGAWLLGTGAGWAADYAETAARVDAARKGMEAAEQTIAQAQGKLQKAIDKVMQAKRFEGPHWVELDQAMKAWSDTVEKQATVMDGHARTLLKLAPSSSLPAAQLETPAFKPLLKQMEGIAKELQASVDRAEAMKRRYQQLEAQTKADIGDAAKGKVADIVLDATKDTIGDVLGVPTDAADFLAKLGGPVTLAAKGVIGAAQKAWGLYYYLDEMASAGRVVKTAQEQLAFIDEYIQKTQATQASARQGVGFLERYMGQREETLARFYQVRDGWLRVAQEATAERTREEIQAFDRDLAKPEPGLHLSGVWPVVEPASLPASEYESEAESILRELRSAAAAAVDGGSPLAFHDILNGHLERLSQRLGPAQERFEQADKSFQQAYSTYITASRAARDAWYLAWWRCHDTNWGNLMACYRSAEAAWAAAENAAIAPLYGPARELAAANRELVRLRQISQLVYDGSQRLVSMMRENAESRRQWFRMSWGEYKVALSEAAEDASTSLRLIPVPGQLSYYTTTAEALQANIAEEIRRGRTDPAALRDRLLERARQIRMVGEITPQAAREYRKGLEALRNVANRAESELSAMVGRYGPLLRYDGVALDAAILRKLEVGRYGPSLHYYGGYLDYTQAAIDTYLERQQNAIRQAFKVEEADYVAEAERFDYAGTARRIEAGLAELDDWVQRLDTFRWRLGNSLAKLDPVSQAITGKPAFSTRPKPLAQQALEELRGGAWSSLATDLERLGGDAELRGALQNIYRMEGTTPRRLLLSVQGGLHALAQDKMRHYPRMRPGFFHPVDEASMKKLDKLWRDLEPLYVRFEALAAGERGKLEGLYALFPDDSRLTQAYQAIPSALTNLVQEGYYRYITEVGALRGYLDIKREALQTVGGDVVKELKDWIAGYPIAKADWERRQAEAAAREEAERQAAETALNRVRQLYQDFATAYQARNLGQLTRMMSADWLASDGSDLNDLEDNLSNSFRVFDRVQYTIGNLSISPLDAGRFQVSYSATITGQIHSLNLKHQETSSVTDIVVLTPNGPRIQSTRGGKLWLQ